MSEWPELAPEMRNDLSLPLSFKLSLVWKGPVIDIEMGFSPTAGGEEGARHETHCQQLLGKLCKDALPAAPKSGFGVRLRRGSVNPKVTQLSYCLSEGMGQAEGCSGEKNMKQERGKVNLNIPLFAFPRFTL